MRTFNSLTISEPTALCFGSAPNPVSLGDGFVIGSGETIPELNYTLPYGTEVSEGTLDGVVELYRTMAARALERALHLGIPRVVLEVEQVFEMTLNPEWGERIARVTREVMEDFAQKGVLSAMRTTVADIRDRVRPPRLRTSHETELVFESLERCAPYSDILSIESTGGKEVSDKSLVMCDPGGVVFALGLLGSNDMEFLWTRIVEIAERHEVVAGGDAACGFANTAMQLAHKKMVPTVFAAMVRAVGAARSLVALECGAQGPDKDCAYEGPILKSIAGIPISMEGKSAACAHSSHIGNVAMACCDLWSNESVPHSQLFGGFTPEVMLEQLWYDCKLMNQATRSGSALVLRNILSDSDTGASPEALVLSPESCIRIAKAIVSTEDRVQRALRAAREALAIIEEAHNGGALPLPELEQPWLGMLSSGLDQFEALGNDALDHYAALHPGTFLPEEYGL